jgi:hypothetical protein
MFKVNWEIITLKVLIESILQLKPLMLTEMCRNFVIIFINGVYTCSRSSMYFLRGWNSEKEEQKT